ncbi:hypothetical protein [Parenemella sanctibonifatiensis]|uniref:Uncharacterized protein n=1 Tax=Parenemella sanctibonifatiensis TaxID=2016505 RepID=A0A255E395_9ACTN|nr:hypothetical protein [Parenemella sanctibonifatiensis]OYN84005.1 hypothetical protein CGZ92_13170 [Parenemella sanctibonifatiensis]
MISFTDRDALTEEEAAIVGPLFTRRHEIAAMDSSLATLRAWEDFILDCEKAEFPHLAASARSEQWILYSQGGMHREAIEKYAQLMQLVHQYGDYIHADNVETFLSAVSEAVVSFEDPSLPLAQGERLIDLVEAAVRARALPLTDVHFARAELALLADDGDAARHWINLVESEPTDRWNPTHRAAVARTVTIMGHFDPAYAARHLEERMDALQVRAEDLTDLEDGPLPLFTLLGSLYAKTGRRADADRIADLLLDHLAPEVLAREAIAEEVLLTLENRPEAALPTVDNALANCGLEPDAWERLAALARNRILADPDGVEGHILRRAAERAADAYDRRSGKDLTGRIVRDFWLAGLPEPTRPYEDAPVELVGLRHLSPGWADSAELKLLLAGWLPRRTEAVSHAPIMLKDLYLETYEAARAAVEAGPESVSVSWQLAALGETLKSTMVAHAAELMAVLTYAEAEDWEGAVGAFEQLQQCTLRHGLEGAEEDMITASQGLFGPMVSMALWLPGISLERIDDLIDTEERIRDAEGLPLAPVVLARLERAVRTGDHDGIGGLPPLLQRTLKREGEDGQVDAAELEVAMIALLLPLSTRWAAELLIKLKPTLVEDRAGQRAQLLEGWLAVRDGDPSGAELVQRVADEHGFEELVQTPAYLLEAAAPLPELQAQAIEAIFEEVDPADPAEVESTAAAARALTSSDPERAAHLQEIVERYAADLDRRNGNDYISRVLAEPIRFDLG